MPSQNEPISQIANCADLELLTVYEISKILSSSLDFVRTAREVLRLLLSYLQMQHGVISLVQESGELHMVGALSTRKCAQPCLETTAAMSVGSKIVKSGSSVVIPDISQDPLFTVHHGCDLAECKGVAFIGVPIKVGRNAIGVLSADRRPGSERRINFGRDVRILTLVANLIGQTWQLHQLVAAERRQLVEEQHRLQKQLQGRYDIENVIGKSRKMKEVFADVHQAAAGSATVLLRGESGTGKEAIANAIHYLSPRAKGPFVKVNCAALPETLLESELFGHEKGAFTGATSERRGRFEQAMGGTLFLDEIGDISPNFQAKLLRVLQEREFERVGSNRTLKADFRLVVATNRNLEEMVRQGEYRADLYFRINVVTIFLPPLRQRREDIPLLVDFFLERFNRENRRAVGISPAAIDVLRRCNWPGNVRELENCIQRTAIMVRGNVIREEDLRCQRGQCFSAILLATSKRSLSATPAPPGSQDDGSPGEDPGEEGGVRPLTERERLVDAMERCGWVQAKAARLLNMTPRQIGYALRKYNIDLKRL